MPRVDYKRCRNCDKPTSEVGQLSHTRLCLVCAHLILDANNEQIHYKQGPAYEHAVRRQLMAARRALLRMETP